MALSSAVGSFNTGTGGVGTTVVVSGLGFQPKVALFWWSGRTETTDASGTAHSRVGFGVAVSTTDRRSVSSTAQNASASIDGGRITRADACVCTCPNTSAVEGLLDLQSWDSDGFTLVVDDAFPSSYRVHYMALGGTDITNVESGMFTEAAATGNQDVTVSFQPNTVLLFGGYFTADPPNTSANRSTFTLGAATSSTNEWYLNTQSGAENAVTSNSASYFYTGEAIGAVTDGATSVDNRYEFVQFQAGGFRLNCLERSSTRRYFYLALAGVQSTVGNFQTQTDTSTQIVVSGLGFQPSAVLLASHSNVTSTQDTVQDHWQVSVGAFTSSSSRVAMGNIDVDNLADTLVATAIEHDECYINLNTSGAVEGLMDVVSVDSGGFTLIMDDADPAQYRVGYLAIGPAAGGDATYTVAGRSLFSGSARGAENRGALDAGRAILTAKSAGAENRGAVDTGRAIVTYKASGADNQATTETATGRALFTGVARGAENLGAVDAARSLFAGLARGAENRSAVDAARSLLSGVARGTENLGGVDAGRAIITYKVSGADNLGAADTATGRALFTGVARGAENRAAVDTGRSVFTGVASCRADLVAVDAGRGIMALRVSGAEVMAALEAGRSVLAYVASGAATQPSGDDTYILAGRAVMGFRASAAERMAYTDAGRSVLNYVGSGRDAAGYRDAGTAILTLRTSVLDAVARVERGRAVLQLIASGATSVPALVSAGPAAYTELLRQEADRLNDVDEALRQSGDTLATVEVILRQKSELMQ